MTSPELAAAVARLRAAGVQTPRVDAELLLAHVLGVPRSRLLLAEPGEAQLAAFDRLVARRAERVPLQHLTGTAPFRYLDLAVGPGVFIPRPETELLIDAVLPTAPGSAVDVCAGSGALAVSLATEVPGCTVYAGERSPEALSWLRRNAEGDQQQQPNGESQKNPQHKEGGSRVESAPGQPQQSVTPTYDVNFVETSYSLHGKPAHSGGSVRKERSAKWIA